MTDDERDWIEDEDDDDFYVEPQHVEELREDADEAVDELRRTRDD